MTHEHDADAVARAAALMSEALGLLDEAGMTLAATHLDKALNQIRE